MIFTEFNENELDNVIGGNSEGMGEEFALKNYQLFREKQIDELKREKEKLQQLSNKTISDELTEQELDNVTAGMKM